MTTLSIPVQVENLEQMAASGQRQQALQRLAQLSYPTHKDETWRRTDPAHFKPENHKVLVPSSTFGTISGQAIDKAFRLGPVEGSPAPLFSVQALDKAPLFAALNGAAHQGGSYLEVGKDQSTGQEALLVHHHYSGKGLAAPRSFLKVGAGSSVTLVEYFSCEADADVLANPTVEVHLEAGAKFRYIFVNQWNQQARVVPTVHARVEKDAYFQMLFAGLGTRHTKAFFESDLVGEGAKSEVLGVVLAQGRQHYDVDAQQNHRVGNTVSDVLCHVALTDRARSVFAGNILCEPGAQKIDGYQQNRNLILSDKARADSMPRLEIEANDVRCTHGASFSTYDADQRFYLQSRGLTAYEAEHLLVTGFFAAVVERMDHEGVAQWLAAKLEDKMQAALGKRS